MDDAIDELPHNVPEARGEEVDITAFVDADHAGNLVTRRSHTGILIFVNMAPVYWYSKRQNTVETSTFGSEFVAMKQCTEYVRGLRYRMRMMGIPVQIFMVFLLDCNSELSAQWCAHVH